MPDAGPSATPPTAQRRWTPLMTAGVCAVVALGGYELCNLGPLTTRGQQVARKVEAAERVRAAARHVCDQGMARDCLRLYDEAKRFDPDGDLAPDVQSARRVALATLAAAEDGGG